MSTNTPTFPFANVKADHSTDLLAYISADLSANSTAALHAFQATYQKSLAPADYSSNNSTY
jgi:hypothetical protein